MTKPRLTSQAAQARWMARTRRTAVGASGVGLAALFALPRACFGCGLLSGLTPGEDAGFFLRMLVPLLLVSGLAALFFWLMRGE